MIARTGEAAKLPFPIHPHMLRHSTGYKLANDGHDTRSLQHYMGHKNIMHTVRYTEMAPDRFKNFWKGLNQTDRRKRRVRFAPSNCRDGRSLCLLRVDSVEKGFWCNLCVPN